MNGAAKAKRWGEGTRNTWLFISCYYLIHYILFLNLWFLKFCMFVQSCYPVNSFANMRNWCQTWLRKHLVSNKIISGKIQVLVFALFCSVCISKKNENSYWVCNGQDIEQFDHCLFKFHSAHFFLCVQVDTIVFFVKSSIKLEIRTRVPIEQSICQPA